VNTPTLVSKRGFRICPLCEASRLLFSSLYEARCPACDHEPSDGFLKTLRQIVDLPEAPDPPEQAPTETPSPKAGSEDEKG
jgi:hypothetical protein